MVSLRHNIIANYIGRSWTAILGIILIPIYIKFIGIEAYGLVGFFATLTSVMGILDLGVGTTMNRELARRSANPELGNSQRDLVRTLEIIYWGVALFAGAIILFGAPFISNSWIKVEKLDPHSVLKAVQLMAISVALRFPMSMYQGGLMGLQKQVLVNIILVANGTLRGVGAIFVLWFVSPTITAFFAWQALISLIGSFAFLIAMWANLPKSNEKPKFNKTILKEIWKYAAAISANAIIGIVLSQLDKVILSKMLTLKMFAYYSIATTVASSIWLIIIPFNTAIFPRLVQLFESNKTEELKILFHKSSQLLSFILIPISTVLIFFSKEILLIWMNDPVIVENAYLIMSFLVCGTLLNGLASIPSSCAPAFGWPILITYTNLIQAMVIIPLIIGMVYWMQGIGASIAWIILNSTYIIFMVPVFFQRYLKEEKRKWYLKDIAKPLLVSFASCFLFWLTIPTFESPFAIITGLFITGIFTLVLTGYSLPFVKSFMINKLNIFFK